MKKEALLAVLSLIILIYGCAQTQPAAEETLPEVGEPQTEPEAEASSGTDVGVVVEQADAETESTVRIISVEELAKHDTEEDCWIVYEGYVFDFTNARMHPNMAKTFYAHCGQETGFEEGAKDRHSGSSIERVENFGTFLGELG